MNDKLRILKPIALYLLGVITCAQIGPELAIALFAIGLLAMTIVEAGYFFLRRP